jgi:hypothetical protein
MGRREGYHIAFAGNGIRTKENAREVYTASVHGCTTNFLQWVGGTTFGVTSLLVLLLLLLDSAVVIDKYECAFVLGVQISLCTLVSWAKVALESQKYSVELRGVHTDGSYSGSVIFVAASC